MTIFVVFVDDDSFIWKNKAIWYKSEIKDFETIVKPVQFYVADRVDYRTFYVIDGREHTHLADSYIMKILKLYQWHDDTKTRMLLFGGAKKTVLGKKQLNKDELKKYNLKS